MENSCIDKINGWLCLDKPAGISSNSAMFQVKKLLRFFYSTPRLGYVGTLDPFATGVLPIAIGEARKFIPYISEEKKEYIFTIVFGISTDTLDLDGKVTESSTVVPSAESLAEILSDSIGVQSQIPPKFSAIKIKGRRACDLTREGKEVSLSSRNVTIFSAELLSESLKKSNEAVIRLICSKGTYVRSFARDIAEKLGSCAYVKSLRRTQSGFFSLNQSITLEKLQKINDNANLMNLLMTVEDPLDDIPALLVDEDRARRLLNGLEVFFFKSELSEILQDSNSSFDEMIRNSENAEFRVRIFSESHRIFRGIAVLFRKGNAVIAKAVRMCSQF